MGMTTGHMIAKPVLGAFEALPNAELVARYRRGVENFDRRVFQLAEPQLDMAFLPEAGVGRWPVRVLLGHLTDAEIVYTHRMRRAVGEDSPLLAVWDENAFIDSGLYAGGRQAVAPGARPIGAAVRLPPIAGFVAMLHTTRRWTAEWLETLAEAEWKRKALHPERGEQTVRSMAVLCSWHLEHHAWYLNAKVERMCAGASAAR